MCACGRDISRPYKKPLLKYFDCVQNNHHAMPLYDKKLYFRTHGRHGVFSNNNQRAAETGDYIKRLAFPRPRRLPFFLSGGVVPAGTAGADSASSETSAKSS